MRRLLVLPFVGVFFLLFGAFFATPTVNSQFATNTPEGNAPSGGFGFATNTPDISPTPTLTATQTLTPTPSPTVTPSPTITPSPTATFTPTFTPSPTPTLVGPFNYPDGFNPLTGLPYPNEEAQARRNLIIKISNFPPLVRPQTGINQADVVFEYETEGGVTRFAAIYRSQTPPLVGSIRSARLVDIELTTMYQALLAYSGTSEPIQNLLKSAPFAYRLISPSLGNNCEDAGFCRYPEGDKAFEHTLFGEPAKMWDNASRRGGDTNQGYRARGFAFSDVPDADGVPTNDVYINWYGQADARWQYQPETERYIRYTENLPHLDKAEGEHLWADNLVIIEVPHANRPDLFPEGASYTSLEIQLWDQGRAYVVREGVVYTGYWRRQNREAGSALQLIYGDNTPIMLKPGRTWVSIVRGFGDVTLSAQPANMVATATAIALTPTSTPITINEGD